MTTTDKRPFKMIYAQGGNMHTKSFKTAAAREKECAFKMRQGATIVRVWDET